MTTVYKNNVQSHQHPSADVLMYGSEYGQSIKAEIIIFIMFP